MPDQDLLILADEGIPHVQQLFRPFGNVVTMAGHDLTASAVQQADVLLVRSVTVVEKPLIFGSRVRFIGTATAGTDHVDLEAVANHGAHFADASGSNADSVVEYVLTALLDALDYRGVKRPDGVTVGVVGSGHVGGRLRQRLEAIGFQVLVSDPPLKERGSGKNGGPDILVDFETILAECDIISLHVPLTLPGTPEAAGHPTFHMINGEALAMMRPEAILINSARGGVVDSSAVLHAGPTSAGRAFIFDVWEGEPLPDPQIVELAYLATPHIAGYSYDGKLAGALILRDALADFLGREVKQAPEEVGDEQKRQIDPISSKDGVPYLSDLAQQAYNIRADDTRMRKAMRAMEGERAQHFRELRRLYPIRRSFSRFAVRPATVPPGLQSAVFEGLGFSQGQEGP